MLCKPRTPALSEVHRAWHAALPRGKGNSRPVDETHRPCASPTGRSGTATRASRSATARELVVPGVACCLAARCVPHSPCVAARQSTRRSSRDARSMDCGRVRRKRAWHVRWRRTPARCGTRRPCLDACTVEWKRLYLEYAPSRFRPNFAHSWTRSMSRHDVIEKRR